MTGHNCTGDGCDLCAALSHTDLGETLARDKEAGEPKLVLVPLHVMREMEKIVHAPHVPTDSAATLDRWASLASILESVLPKEA